MKRVMEKADQSLFSPSDTPDLHDKYGKAFEQAHLAYEEKSSTWRNSDEQESRGTRFVAQDAVDVV